MTVAALRDRVADLWPAARPIGDQLAIRGVFMRGGTSRGAFLRAEDLPPDPVMRDRAILALYGSPDARQIDGLGGADPLTSKIAIVGPPTLPGADVDYLFGQVRIAEPVVDYRGNCGNMLAAIGPFAIDEGLVPATEPTTRVRIHQVNTRTLVVADVPTRDGRALVEGLGKVPGVPGSGASIRLDFAASADTLGRGLLPTGNAQDDLTDGDRTYRASIVDAGNPTVFLRAADLGLDTETLLASRYPQSTVHYLHAPLLLDSADVRDALLEDSSVRATLTAASQCELALVGIGEMGPDATVFRANVVSGPDRALLLKAGVIGSLCGHFFDRLGRPAGHLDGRTIALGWSQLERIPTTVAVAAGASKLEAICGALRTGCIKVLVTDQKTAEGLLECSDRTDMRSG